MESQEIVKTFLSSGFQLVPETLKFFSDSPTNIQLFLEKAKSLHDKPNIITKDVVESVIGKQQAQIKILKNFEQRKEPFTVEETTRYFNDRYEKLRKILSLRIDLINLMSINKVSPNLKKFSLIGMVKSKDLETKTAIAEDNSGSTTINFPDSLKDEYKTIVEDEVIGMVCGLKDNEVYVEKIIWPDVPIKREIRKSEEELDVFIISGLDFDVENFQQHSYEKMIAWMERNAEEKFVLVILGEVKNKEKLKELAQKIPKNWTVISEETFENSIKINDPSLLQINGVNLMMMSGDFIESYQKIFETSPESTVVSLLKKRHLNPKFEFSKKIFADDQLFLEDVPDVILVSHFKKPGLTNYKGTTVISNGSFSTEPIYWIINLKTRETIKIDFT